MTGEAAGEAAGEMTGEVTGAWFDDLGRRHRDGAPAVVRDDGSWTWFRHGQRHRDDGPAERLRDGTLVHVVEGTVHRDVGPAVYQPGTDYAEYFRHGRQHRLDGPAVTCAGATVWFVDDEEVPNARCLDQHLAAGGDTALIEATLTLWEPGDDVAELLESVKAASDRRS